MTNGRQDKSGQRLLLQYAGFAAQLLASLGAGAFIGHWADQKIGWSVPILTCLLPLLILVVLLIKVARDTSRK